MVALLVAALVAVAAWWALRAVPRTEPVPLASTGAPVAVPTVAPSVPAPGSGTPSASTPSGGVPVSVPAGIGIVVDVAGKVRRPGIVELPPGSRVVDALAAAGGARPGVDTAGLNLARPLVDGEQIVVGLEVPTDPAAGPALPSSTATSAAPLSVDINTATQPELETLPGIGPVTAQSILDWRAQNGAFTSVDQLLDVSGIGDATLADIAPYVHV